jgi:hypothetical protein
MSRDLSMRYTLTTMRLTRPDSRLEGSPSLSKFFGGPCIPPLADQCAPCNVVLCIEVKGRDSERVVRMIEIIVRQRTY